MPRGAREKLVGLLDYVEQVIRLDERVAFRLSEYRLPDGTTFAVKHEDTRSLPGIQHDLQQEEGSVWLEVSRLARREPPTPPPEIIEWIALSSDPARLPEARTQRIITVAAVERDAALARSEVRPTDIMEAPRSRDDPPDSPARFDLTLRLEDRPEAAGTITHWIEGPWAAWATEELPRRRTIALYQQLYKVFQLVEVGGGESAVEVIWGIGMVHWEKDGRVLDRPLLEVRVDVELDDNRGGLIRVRPTSADPAFDLKPYEEFGCTGLPQLSELIRRELRRCADDEGLSPFLRGSFEPILSAAAARLDPDGTYTPDDAVTLKPKGETRKTDLAVSDAWVLFARPRTQHVVLQDIERLRNAAEDAKREIGGVAERLVTDPSKVAITAQWAPLDHKIGGSGGGDAPAPDDTDTAFDVFFPKPFNDDQIEIVRRLKGADGLVVQGPPGTGKTHTIANIICHAMATGQRVLVVSRGESALAVLKEQLPQEVQPLAISVLSNERQGLRQMENAIREIQAVVEGTRPENRRSAIKRMEAEIQGLRLRIDAIDRELDSIAAAHLSKIGPRGESPAELAQRITRERDAFQWFTDRPVRFASETSLKDEEIAALRSARLRAGEWFDHRDALLPSPADLPKPDIVRSWHEDLIRSNEFSQAASGGPVRSLKVAIKDCDRAIELAEALDKLADSHPDSPNVAWLRPFRRAAVRGDSDAWMSLLRERLAEWEALESERALLARRSVELPEYLLGNADACAAITRAAAGERLWPRLAVGKSTAKSIVAAVKLDGSPVREDDVEGWGHISSVVVHASKRSEVSARWQTFVAEVDAPAGATARSTINSARVVLAAADNAYAESDFLSTVVSQTVGIEDLTDDPNLCRALAEQIRSAGAAVRLASVQESVRRSVASFRPNADRTSLLALQLLEEVLGKPQIPPEKIETVWAGLLLRLEAIRARAGDFATIASVTRLIADSGAPRWAERLRTEAPGNPDVVLRSDWRDAWDFAAADARLAAIDARERLAALAREREDADKRCRKLFADLVRERTFYELNRRLSPSVKAALVQFVRALARIGRGTGKTAALHRRTARDAMAQCYDAVPCWIMPTWRVAEQLPAELGAVDLVIIDEASQSDVTELPALLRGKKILVVGDDRQVSPTAPFVTQAKINQLRHHFLGDLPFSSLLEPGESIYDLMRAVFPNERLMLKEHFRCVEPIIRFSMQFYPEKMIPLRIPEAGDRLDPPLVDIYLPHGTREKRRKINRAEAELIVDEIKTLTTQPAMRNRTFGVISLVGSEQAEFIRAKLSESIGEELMQRHAILCGDSATFQGTERDIVFLSMVADPIHKTALTMLRYEQRFNVAVSRGRDRVVLVRSVRRDELNPTDLKARLIEHFENPMPLDTLEAAEGLAACESGFERDLMQRVLDKGYRVRPQVGSLGFRIDMVVEGPQGHRLAVECDGDRFHGPQQWREDMRRQRVLERVGWRFWRCFASSFYRDTERVMIDLFETLSRMGIEPIGKAGSAVPSGRFTEHRVVTVVAVPEALPPTMDSPTAAEVSVKDGVGSNGVANGDKIILLFADDKRRLSLRMTEEANDFEKGQLSSSSKLGKAIAGAEEGDEIEFQTDEGTQRKALIEVVEKASRASV